MPAGTLNLPPIEKGATFRHQIVWKDSNGTPINLTGCTARAQVREDYDSTSVLLSYTTENGRLTLGGTAGTIDFYVSDTDTEALLGEGGKYDLEIAHPSGDVTRLVEGAQKFKPEITRP